MKLPEQVPVMTLPSAILFPQAMLPLFIFEKRYRVMLEDVIEGNRMFAIALQKPGRVREAPSLIAGLGLVRASVRNKNGTSHLILQGIARVRLESCLTTKPYRIHRMRGIQSVHKTSKNTKKLINSVLGLARDRIKLGLHHFPSKPGEKGNPFDPKLQAPMTESILQSLSYLSQQPDPEPLIDLVACTLLSSPLERQIMLETPVIEDRLRQLIQFLKSEILRHAPEGPASEI